MPTFYEREYKYAGGMKTITRCSGFGNPVDTRIKRGLLGRQKALPLLVLEAILSGHWNETGNRDNCSTVRSSLK